MPAAILPVADTCPPVTKLPELTFPDTDRLTKVPVLVIFGCAAVVKLPVNVVNDKPVPLMLPVAMLPVTLNASNVPTLVIVGCAVFTENIEPVNVSPDPAVYDPAPEN